MRRRCGIGTICVVSALAYAQSGSPSAIVLSADLARYYFLTPEAEIAARVDLNGALDRVQQFQGKISSAASLLGVLHAYEAVIELAAKHESYLHLRCANDRKDAACDANQKLASYVDSKTAFLTPEILAIPENQLNAYLKEEPSLGAYRFALEEIRRDAPHTLPTSEETLLEGFQPQIGDWQYDLYEQIVGGVQFGSAQTAEGSLDVIRQRSLIASHPDPHVREEGFKRRYAGFTSRRDLLAFSLIHTVQAQSSLAKAHKYVDAPARKYESLGFKPEDTRSLLGLMARNGTVSKRFESIRSKQLEHDYKQPAKVWDLSAPEPGFRQPITSLADAGTVFHRAFAGLGAEYQAAFDALMDPANGRTDILPGGSANRYGGGFSIGFPGSTSMLFYGRYDGTFKDLSVIAHEGGHAVHRSLMAASKVAPSYATGPNFLFESFAAFNELVLADFMAEHSTTPELKRFYRERWMYIKGLDAFDGAKDALLEQAIYDGVAAGTVRSADDLDKLTLQIESQFSQFAETTPELRSRWATMSLMWEDPLYNVNYAYGGLLALKYFQLYTTRHDWFVPRYIALLKNGFDQTPTELLKRFLEIDLSGPELLKDDLELLDARLQRMETEASPK
jgi:oligoendopeptidase F